VVSQVEHPLILRKTEMSRLWYKPDTKFHTPKACIQIQFNCPECHYSPEASVMTRIFTRLLVDYLNEYGEWTWALHLLCLLVELFAMHSNHFALQSNLWSVQDYRLAKVNLTC
jgi:hypothetical protein